ncbi:hypothetical protein PHYBLDRAFT_69845 [Phycomyces blakesleeanus NRRL 1555(-)]|uniref:Uncharacterized protein n=1 Tax=Phycomyces blakesleeanus (strain ATCC 8743b / DSM 1359 / FGSC 10004 / NBRC 33097 / NRRL 1555) TaxID=763407 RepID=A0A162QA50_PHYB8|nr:hypothetical protein PHYBLDRAFT_69845 [Phycomyces blakesleeanus NRRL 1555(-)]OAD81346.1 hypothetical protein PHYBLDRAFT_69845 [Phycomyces blakesleeanus NRRL 1555(-)]|eukprot:XP_018299386.1 hypothetical protein PHYBLDRAFT_69845 [Phycomyces blakesleeanus NRRL 1555(-)]
MYIITRIKSWYMFNIIPVYSYILAHAKWTTTNNAYTLYVTRDAKNDNVIPVLVALHEEVNYAKILKTINLCAMVYVGFRLLSTVLMISISGPYSLKDNNVFDAVANSFLDFNTQQFVINVQNIEKYLNMFL